MDTADQWALQANSGHPHLGIGLVVKHSSLEEIVPSAGTTGGACTARPQLMERRPRPQKEQALSCPRCQSTNTKFCYYNNYSLTQPRYFCKTCRRYWTEGGSLRNVPVGGGSRKNKRASSSSTITTKTSTPSATPTSSQSSSATSAARSKLPSEHLAPGISSFQNPKYHDGQDLNLAFPPQQHLSRGLDDQFPTVESSNPGGNPAANPATRSYAANNGGSLSAMELLRTGLSGHVAPGPFLPMMAAAEAGAVYPSIFGLQDFRPASSLSFSLQDGTGGPGGSYTNVQGVQEGTGGRVFFPYENLRQVSSNPAELIEENRVVQEGGGDPSGFWNGVMGGGAGSW